MNTQELPAPTDTLAYGLPLLKPDITPSVADGFDVMHYLETAQLPRAAELGDTRNLPAPNNYANAMPTRQGAIATARRALFIAHHDELSAVLTGQQPPNHDSAAYRTYNTLGVLEAVEKDRAANDGRTSLYVPTLRPEAAQMTMDALLVDRPKAQALVDHGHAPLAVINTVDAAIAFIGSFIPNLANQTGYASHEVGTNNRKMV